MHEVWLKRFSVATHDNDVAPALFSIVAPSQTSINQFSLAAGDVSDVKQTGHWIAIVKLVFGSRLPTNEIKSEEACDMEVGNRAGSRNTTGLLFGTEEWSGMASVKQISVSVFVVCCEEVGKLKCVESKQEPADL